MVSNIPGPPEPLWMLGCPLEEAYPIVPFADSHSLSVGLTTVCDEAFLGLYADRRALPDADRLAELVDARVRRAARRRRGRSRPNRLAHMKELAPGLFQLPRLPAAGHQRVSDGRRAGRRRHPAGGQADPRQLKGRQVTAHALTHAHPDHQGASHEVCTALGIPFWVGERDADAAEDPRLIAERQPRPRLNRLVEPLLDRPGPSRRPAPARRATTWPASPCSTCPATPRATSRSGASPTACSCSATS